MDFKNELILNGEMGTNGLPIRENVEESYRAGIEFSLTYEPIKGLILSNTTSYSINKVVTDLEVLNHVMSPNWLVNQSIVYDIKGFEFGVDMKYRSRMYFDITNFYELNSSLRFGVQVKYNYRNLTFGMCVNNIFNERSFSNGMLGVNGPLYFVDSPRNFHIDIRWAF